MAIVSFWKLHVGAISKAVKFMPDNNSESLILKEQAELAAQPFLFSEKDLPKNDKTKARYHCTGQRLFEGDPERYKRVVRLLAEPGVSIRMIVQECQVSDHTIRSVAARERIPIATQKEAILADLGHVQRLCVDRMIELVPEAALKDVTLCFGVTTDKHQLLSGEATMRVEQTERVDIFTSFPDFVKQLEARGPIAGENNPEGLAGGRLPVVNAELVPESAGKVQETYFAGGNSLEKALMNGEHEPGDASE
jgi:hypothetical protein